MSFVVCALQLSEGNDISFSCTVEQFIDFISNYFLDRKKLAGVPLLAEKRLLFEKIKISCLLLNLISPKGLVE